MTVYVMVRILMEHTLEISSNEKKLFDFLLEKKDSFIVDFFSNYSGEIKNPVSVKGIDIIRDSDDSVSEASGSTVSAATPVRKRVLKM